MLSHLWKLFKFLFLLTLPLTILPLFQGSLGGLLFPLFQARHITKTTECYLQNVKSAVSDWGVGGDAPSFQQFQDKNNGFHLTRVNSNDWLRKLGFLLPKGYSDINYVLEHDTPIDKQASLSHLMRKKNSTKPREQWLFLTSVEWIDWDGWNAAFDDFLQYSYTNPRLNNSVAFHFAECSTASTASFLCNVWNTRSPALIQFLVEDDNPSEPSDPAPEEEEEELTYTTPLSNLLPVQVRIIELGLQEAYTGHPWTTFPSKTLQLHSLIAKEGMLQQFPPYTSPDELLLRRFNEYMDKLDAPGTILNAINEADWWMVRNVNEPLGIEEVVTFLHSLSFTISLVGAMFVDAVVVRPTQWLWDEFLGTPKAGDVVFAGMEFDERDQGDSGEEDLMGDIFGMKDFFRRMEVEIQQASSAAGRAAQGATDPPPETTSAGWRG